MKLFSTKEFSELAGVSIRTLKRWLKKGILKPVTTRDNGYNFYSQEQLTTVKGMTRTRDIVNSQTRDTVDNVTPFAKGMTQTCDNVNTQTRDTVDNVTPLYSEVQIVGVQTSGVQNDTASKLSPLGGIRQKCQTRIAPLPCKLWRIQK